MRFNERELIQLSASPGDLEGRLGHRPPTAVAARVAQVTTGGGGGEKRWRERWFKLLRNLLFYYRLNEHGGVSLDGQPTGLLVLERCDVRVEPPHTSAGRQFCFSVSPDGDTSRRHIMACSSAKSVEQWTAALTAASYSSLRAQLRQLRAQVQALSGVDPLKSRPGERTLKNLTSVEDALRDENANHGGSCALPVPPERSKRKQATFQSHLVNGSLPEHSSLLD